MNFPRASLFSTCAVTAFVAEVFLGGNLPVVVHIVAGEVAETVVMAAMEDTGTVAHPLVDALIARTPDSPAGRVEVAGKLEVVAGCLERQDQKCPYP